jgi:hypothetical protein
MEKMETQEKITLFISIFALILSIINIIMYFIEYSKKYKKFLDVILQLDEFSSEPILIIENIGLKPITLTGIQGYTYENAKDKKSIQNIPPGSIFVDNTDIFLDPRPIVPGEVIRININHILFDYFYNQDKKVVINLYDSQGNSYGITRAIMHNAKWGGSEKIKNRFVN